MMLPDLAVWASVTMMDMMDPVSWGWSQDGTSRIGRRKEYECYEVSRVKEDLGLTAIVTFENR